MVIRDNSCSKKRNKIMKKQYIKPLTETIKQEAEALLVALSGSDIPVNPEDARSKQFSGVFDDGDGDNYGD